MTAKLIGLRQIATIGALPPTWRFTDSKVSWTIRKLRCEWCGRPVSGETAHPENLDRSLRSFSPLIGGSYECRDNAACAERMRKKGL